MLLYADVRWRMQVSKVVAQLAQHTTILGTAVIVLQAPATTLPQILPRRNRGATEVHQSAQSPRRRVMLLLRRMLLMQQMLLLRRMLRMRRICRRMLSLRSSR